MCIILFYYVYTDRLLITEYADKKALHVNFMNHNMYIYIVTSGKNITRKLMCGRKCDLSRRCMVPCKVLMLQSSSRCKAALKRQYHNSAQFSSMLILFSSITVLMLKSLLVINQTQFT